MNNVEDPFREIVVCTSHGLSEYKNFKHIKLIADKEHDHYERMKKVTE